MKFGASHGATFDASCELVGGCGAEAAAAAMAVLTLLLSTPRTARCAA